MMPCCRGSFGSRRPAYYHATFLMACLVGETVEATMLFRATYVPSK
jgi:hypothetical protein